jgi:sugar-specific transcriptional regulator TrmB/DNA-binding CsgD family transcriptional regulator
MLRDPELELEELTAHVGRSRPWLTAALSRLESAGLVTRASRHPARWRPARPDAAIDILVARQRTQLDQVSEIAKQWLAEMNMPRGDRHERLVEVVVGQDAVAARFAQLLQSTGEELLVLDRPPYASVGTEADRSVRGLLAKGVLVRGIYSPDSLALPGAVEQAHSASDAGERSRVHPDVPMKLAVSDRQQALLPLAAARAIDSALVVHSSALLDALVRLFELLWDQGLPVVGDPVADLDSRLLTMLTAGMKDDAIARRLGISTRTVGRSVAQLMNSLGARTRFQAGAHAERQLDRSGTRSH